MGTKRRGTGLRFSILSLLILGGFPAYASESLSMTTLNIRWFGIGGRMSGNPGEEYRDGALAEYFERSGILDQDVLAFQEIVDVDRLRALLPGHQCVSYLHPEPNHQHVVLCARAPLRLGLEKGDDNFAIESVALPGGKFRPAVHGVLKTPTGSVLAHLIAVHLKAQPDQTDMRLRQVEILKRSIERLPADGQPVFLLGDFNSHLAGVNGRDEDDWLLFDRVLREGEVPLSHVYNPATYTYRTFEDRSHLDHFWVSPGTQIEEITVGKACNSNRGTGFDNPAFYYEFVSDHCPVSAVFTWGDPDIAVHPEPTPPRLIGMDLLPELKKGLVLPPAPGSELQAMDEKILFEMQRSRKPEDSVRAKSEVQVGLKSFFGKPYGPLSDEEVEGMSGFFEQIRNDTNYYIQLLKKEFPRQRPFLYLKGLEPSVPKETTGAYPSGHSAIAWVYALILSDLNPDLRSEFERRAEVIAMDRVISGMHHPTDIQAGKQLGYLIYAKLKESALYQEWFRGVLSR